MSTTLTAPGSPRWPLPPHGHAWRPGCIGLAVLVHVAVIGICAALVRPPAPAGPAQEQSVEWVFAPPASSEAAPPAPQPQETASPPPALTASIPAPPASAPTPEPEPPEPEPAPLPQQQAEAPPPAEAVPATEPAPQPEAPPQQAEAIPPAAEPAVPIPPPPPPQAEALPRPPSPPAPLTPAPAPRQPRHLQASRSTPKPPAAAPQAPALPAPAHDLAATPAPRAPAGDDTAVLLTWERAVSAWLAAHRVYPYEARRRGEEGSVLLRFTADRDGRVSDVALVRSTGSPILDDAAQAAVRDATLPPFAAGMSQQKVTITVQIRYALRN